jgi:Clostripain family
MKNIFALFLFLFLALNPLAGKAAEKEWTLLVFLNGNNSLDSFGPLNINQMEKVGSTDAVNIVVQWASLQGGFTHRLYVQKDNDDQNVTSPIVQELGKTDMGDYNNLEDFIKWGITHYPAKHYFVTVWDHGSGWRAARLRGLNPIHLTDISWDDNTGHSITTKQLGQVMNDVSQWLGRKIDVYGSDACLMGMVEVAGDMSKAVDYFVGSQDLEPGAGWPYDQFLAPLAARPGLSPRELASVLTEEYTKSYENGSNGTADATMSTVDMSRYGNLKDAISALAGELRALPKASETDIFKAAQASQSFAYHDYVDLADFLDKLKTQNVRGISENSLSKASRALNDYVILSRNTSRFPGAHGVSIWIPKDTATLNNYVEKYNQLDFGASTRWADALAAFVGQ